VGRISIKKGLEVLFSAVREIPDAFLTLVGEGQDREYFIEQAKEMGITERIHWIGKVPHGEVYSYLASFDALVLSSLTTPGWKEQFGHVLIEAMSAGIPVIASNSGVIPEVVEDAGLLFPEGDSSALKECILALMDSESDRSNLIEKSKKRAEERFSNRAIADQTYEIWKRVIAGE
jgi:glycosyltransferase involved in cell wall biosynthesis